VAPSKKNLLFFNSSPREVRRGLLSTNPIAALIPSAALEIIPPAQQLSVKLIIKLRLIRWKIIVKVLASTKFQKFNSSFVDINAESVLPVFEFEKLAPALQWLTMFYIGN
jgi:hypothetical protein